MKKMFVALFSAVERNQVDRARSILVGKTANVNW